MKYAVTVLFISLLVNTSLLGNHSDRAEPDPYQSLEALPTNLQGFFGDIHRKYLKEMIGFSNPKVVVELGSWLGASTVFLANNTHVDTKVYAVDHWLGSIEHQEHAGFSAMLPTLYQQFLSNIKNLHLTHKVMPVRMTTVEAAEYLNIQVDMIYVDASHDEESVYQDVMAWYPKLNSKGIMCGDDFNWPSVESGIRRAAKELGQTIHAKGGDDPFWWFDAKE